MRQRNKTSGENKQGGKKVVNPKFEEGMDTTDKICLGIFCTSIVGIILVLIGMQTGYTPCYFMKQMELETSCSSGH
jgi:hypothetical protein